MTEEQKHLIAIEIDKYFRMRPINTGWFSVYLKTDIERPDDGFEPQNMSNITIKEDSIKFLRKDLYSFSGNATVMFRDKTSQVGRKAEVEFSGQAKTLNTDERIWVENLLLTGFHRTTDIIPKNDQR